MCKISRNSGLDTLIIRRAMIKIRVANCLKNKRMCHSFGGIISVTLPYGVRSRFALAM